MPSRGLRPCTTPGCGGRCPSGRCDGCRTRRRNVGDTGRGSAHQRGYTGGWKATRLDYLTRNPWCVLCGAGADVADHHPESRRDLVAAGVDDPDCDEQLRPLCTRCHNRATAQAQPGGWFRLGNVDH